MARDKLGNAFHDTMDVLATPAETIASGMSMFTGHPESPLDAYKNHLQPSEVLFGMDSPTSGLGKAASFAGRFLVDTLLDPMTYVTMGSYEGLFGLSKLSSIPLKEHTAAELGIKDLYKTGKDMGDGFISSTKEAIRHQTLSREGQQRLGAITTRIENQIKQDTLESSGFGSAGSSARGAGVELNTPLPGTNDRFISADNIRGRITKTLQSLIGKSPEELAEAITGGKLQGAEAIAVKNLARIASGYAPIEAAVEGAELGTAVGPEGTLAGGLAGLAAGAVAKMAPAALDSWSHAINLATKQAMDDQAARLVRHTLQARRGEIDAAAKEQLSRVLERSALRGHTVVDKLGQPVVDQFGNKMVRNLAQTILDKGGLKFAGQSVISGARIRQVMNLLKPAEDSVNGFSKPAARALADISRFRNTMSSLFSTNWTSTGRIPDSMLQIARQAKFKQESQLNDFLNTMERMGKRMQVPADEMKLAFTAATLGKEPANGGEGRLTALYHLMHSQNGNKVMKDIAAGVYGEGIDPQEVNRMWAAANFVKRQLQQNLVMSRDAGMDVYEQKNYLPLLFNEPKHSISPFLTTQSAEAVNASKGQMNKWTNVEDPSKVLFGPQEGARDVEGNYHNLKQYNKVEQRNRVMDNLDQTVMKTKARVDDLKGEVEGIWGKVNDRFKKSLYEPNESALKDIAGTDKYNYKALQSAFESILPDVDREKLLSQFAEKSKTEAEAVVKASGLSMEDITKLKSKLQTGDKDLDSIVQKMLSNAKDFTVNTTKKVEGAATKEPSDIDEALKKMQNIVKENGLAAKQRVIERALTNDGSFKEVLAKLSDEWHENPSGVKGLLESITNRHSEVERLMSDLSGTRRTVENEMNQPGLTKVADRWYYKDSEGATYERQRATAEEINKNYFDSKEMFSETPFEPFFHSTENVLRTVNTKYLLKDIAEKFGVPQSMAPSNYVKVSVAGMGEKEGGLADMMAKMPSVQAAEALYYHPSVAQNIVQIMKVMDKDPATSDLLSWIDRMTNIFKVSVTSPFPAFHGRNALSNVWQSMMDIGVHALDPAQHMMSIQLQRTSKQMENLMLDLSENPTADNLQKYFELSDKVVLKDQRGYEWTAGELDRVLRDNVVAYNPSVLGMMDAGLTPGERMKELNDMLFTDTNKWGNAKRQLNPLKQSFAPYAQGRNIANYMESEPRILNFLANLRNTGDVSFAAHQTKQFLYDHSNLTPFERNVLRRVLPFYAYTRKNTEAMVRNFIGKPGRLDWFRNAYTTMGDALAGGNLSQEERDQLPDWMKDSLDLVVARDGENVKLITSLGSPFEAPFDELSRSGLFGAMNPLIKGPIENATGYSFFEGKPLSQVTDATAFKSAPQAIKDLIGFTTKTYTDSTGKVHTMYVSLNPRMMNVFNNLPLTSRTLSAITLIQNPNVDTQNKILANLFGIKPTPIDLSEEQYQRQKQLDGQIQQILSSAGVGYQRTEYTAPTGTHLVLPPRNPENLNG